MKLAPYDLPLQWDYRSKSFERSSRRWKPAIEKLLFKRSNFTKGLHDIWVSYHPVGQARPGSRRNDRWTAKLYVCVGASSYWPTIRTFIKRYGRSKTPWKFFMAPDGYQRPDKLVFYFDSGRRLRRFVKAVRPLLPKNAFHEMRHAASTSQMGVERKEAKGLYVGMDPPLGVSWRYYRCFCSAWAELNERYLESLPKGKKGWFERMNLSTEHEGPHGLSPDPKDLSYIRRFWRTIHCP